MSSAFATSVQERHRAAADRLPGAALPWLARYRAAGLAHVTGAGLPTHRTEAWKYTPLRSVEAAGFDWAAGTLLPGAAPAAAGANLPTVTGGAARHRLVLVNGRYRPDLSTPGELPGGVVLTGLAAALESHPALVAAHLEGAEPAEGDPLVALNAAFLDDGVLLHVGRGIEVEHPVELVLLTEGTGAAAAWHPRLLVSLEDNAGLTLVEHHAGSGGATLSNIAAQLRLGPGARLRHTKFQAEGAEAVHLAHSSARVARDASLEQFVLTLGARLSRNEFRVTLAGPGATAHVSGAYAVAGQQHSDFTSLIEHAEPHGTSRQVVHGVINDKARAVFQGKILVRPHAQKTDGYQLNRALLLSDSAEIDSKPELEIHADDVKCSHGATTGALDETALFYLRARGVPLDEARSLLVDAFMAEALEEISHEAVRAFAAAHVRAWQEARR